MSTPINTENFKKKSFWSKPEGVTGGIFLVALLAGAGYLATLVPWGALFASTISMIATLGVIGLAAFMVLDPKTRNLFSYGYKSIMRKITGLFVTIDPIGILKNYVSDLEANLRKMSEQIGGLRGQIRKLDTIIQTNSAEIEKNMQLANMAKRQGKDNQVILSTRKAARLKESNKKYDVLKKRMEVMHRILKKMYSNSEILLEDTRDQVKLKEQERSAIRASHSAMKSARSVISGDPDKRAMFDAAMEHIADDVANKVGEMERFMEMSSTFMDSVDLQNGVFEEKGLKMLEDWEKKSTLMLMGDGPTETLDLNEPVSRPELRENKSGDSSYENLFD